MIFALIFVFNVKTLVSQAEHIYRNSCLRESVCGWGKEPSLKTSHWFDSTFWTAWHWVGGNFLNLSVSLCRMGIKRLPTSGESESVNWACMLVYCLTQSKYLTPRVLLLLLLLRVCLEKLMRAWKNRKWVRNTSPDQEEFKPMFTHSATPILSTYSVPGSV